MNLEKAVQLRMDTDGHGFTAFFAGDMIHPEGEPRSVINEVGTEICWRRIRDRYFCSLKAALRVSGLEWPGATLEQPWPAEDIPAF